MKRNGKKLMARFGVDHFPQQTGLLEQHGLGVLQVALLHPLLIKRNVLPSGGPAPRSCAELTRMLEK